MSDLHRVCVYAASTAGPTPAYAAAAHDVGTTLARAGVGIVYGGGRAGLMGTLADAALAAGGEVVGVIPDFLYAREVGHERVTTLHVVGSMHERKALMAEQADAFLALPGGIGTLEELVEALTWLQLGLHPRPIGLLDVDGFWTPFLALLDGLVDGGFMPRATRDAVRVDTSAAGLLAALTRPSAGDSRA